MLTTTQFPKPTPQPTVSRPTTLGSWAGSVWGCTSLLVGFGGVFGACSRMPCTNHLLVADDEPLGISSSETSADTRELTESNTRQSEDCLSPTVAPVGASSAAFRGLGEDKSRRGEAASEEVDGKEGERDSGKWYIVGNIW